MRRSNPRIPFIAFALTSQIVFSSARAADFTVNDGVTDTAAKTLGSAAGQTGTVNPAGILSVSGSTVAITVTGNNETLNNNGTIRQTGTGRVIRDNTGVTGLVINNGSLSNSTAKIQSADADVIQMNQAGGSVTLNNYGTMTSLNPSAGGSQVVDFNAITTGANTVNNFATGIMQASQADVVRPGVNGLVNNSGTILSTSTNGSSSDGVDVQSNTGVTVVNANNWSAAAASTPGSGLIEGARHGITGGPGSDIAFTTTITNNLGGTIQGDNGSGINLDGFSGLQTATIINNGTITGNGHDFSGNLVSRDGDGIDVDGIANITNTGIIRSINAFTIPADGVARSEGITIGGGAVTNSGTIEGLVASGNTNAVGRGITFSGNDITTGPLAGTREAIYGNAVVNNNAGGLIRGQSDSAIAVEGPASGSGYTVQINNNSGATIQGGGATNAAIWVRSDNVPTNPGVTVMNRGTIDGSSSGKAIALGQGNDTVQLFGGTVIGTIDGGAGSNTLQTNGSQTFTGGTILNFQNLNVLGGTTTMNGSNTFTGGATVASGGILIVGSSEVNNSARLIGNVAVSSGAALAGHGGITGSVTNSGTVAPGGSIGTLTVSGNYVQNSGGNLATSITPTGNSVLAVTGTASLAGSFTIDAGSGTYTKKTYTLLTSSGLSGSFSGSSGNLSTYSSLDYYLSYDANNAYLTLRASTVDTQQSLVNNAQALQSIFSMESSVINNGLNYDLPLSEKSNMGIATGARYSRYGTGVLLLGGFRVNDHVRTGLYLDQGVSSSLPAGIELRQHSPLFGAFGVWQARQDGLGAQMKVAAGYNDSDLTVTRPVVGTSDPGSGSTNLVSQAVALVGSYGVHLKGSWIATPYAGIRYTDVKASGYTEAASDTVTSPLSYAGLRQSATTLLAGIRLGGRLSDRISFNGSAGVEHETNNSSTNYTANSSIISGLNPVVFNTNVNRTRPVASLGATVSIDNRQELAFSAVYREEAFSISSTTSVYGTYTIRF
ncbi:MAG TPA: autotransporter outer membrane beta-barrel domain-containing protein [Chlorobaculum sp.]|nr:autotransporter outer membrane beta-barrel domain-containing protein [Chlorobaculum sp.]